LTKTLLIYSVSYFNWGSWRFVWVRVSPPKAARDDWTVLPVSWYETKRDMLRWNDVNLSRTFAGLFLLSG